MGVGKNERPFHVKLDQHELKGRASTTYHI